MTELWERFSFYGLQGILTYYLLYSVADGGLELTPSIAVGIVGAYGGAVYLAQLPGAWIADRILAPRYLVVVGGSVITVGHLTLALAPGLAGLLIGLALIAIGTGGLKTSITSIVGLLYQGLSRTDRDAGFSYFYMAISIGSVAGPLLVGFTQSRWGFHMGFALAALGMIVALAQYVASMRSQPAVTGVVKNPITISEARRAVVLLIGGLMAIGTALAIGWIDGSNANYVVGAIIVTVFVGYMVMMLRAEDISTDEKRRVRGFIPMWCASTLYYGYAGMVFTTVPLIVNDRVNRDVHGFQIPEAWFALVGSVVVVVVLPFMASTMKETRLGRARPTSKYATGFAVMGIAWLLMLSTQFFPGQTVPALLVCSCLAIAGLSEVFIGPISLSLATRIAPTKFTSQIVALQILAIGGGATIYGSLGALFTVIPAGLFYILVGSLALGTAVAIKLSAGSIEKRLSV